MMLFSSDSLVNITSPLDLDSLFYWFAADQGVTDSLGGAIATDEGVGTWADLSGNGYDVTQATNGARPVYKATGGPGSKPTIQFDGSNDFLASAAHWWGSDDLTVFVVTKFGNATRVVNDRVLGKAITTTNQRQWFVFAGSSGSYRITLLTSTNGTAQAQAEGASKSTTWKVHAITSTGSNDAAFYEDGNTTTSTSTSSAILDSSIPELYIGTTGGLVSYFQGSISEIIVYSRALTTAERQAIETYLNRKYDLY